MKRFGILALLLLLGAHHPAHAQTGPTACTAQTQSVLLNSFSDTAGPGTITPRNMRDFVCSTTVLNDAGTISVNVTAAPYRANNSGASDASAAIQSAVTAACAAPKSLVYIPSGTYDIASKVTVTSGCSGLTIRCDPGTTTLLLDPANASTGSDLLAATNVSYLTIQGCTFDGNVAATTNTTPLIGISAPSDHFVFRNNIVQNVLGTALNIVGQQNLTGSVNAQTNAGNAVLNYASTPAGVGAGSYSALSAQLDPDMFVASTTGTTVTMNRVLPDTILSGATTQFTRNVTSSADANYGDLSISTTDTSSLTVGQTVYLASPCIAEKTTITGITSNTSFAISRKILCNIPSGSHFAVASGNSDVTIDGNVFAEIGQPLLYGSSKSYTTTGPSSGSTMTFPCNTAGTTGCDRAGLVPGQMTAATGLPAGVPANDLITNASFNAGAHTFTITLQNALTGTVADSTSVPFQVSRGGLGYGVWFSWGAPFANLDAKFLGNRFVHTWSSPIFADGLARPLFQGNSYQEDGMEFVDPVTAPSACLLVDADISPRILGESCSGASGTGLEMVHSINAVLNGGQWNANGTDGLTICGGHDLVISGSVVTNDNGQWHNRPYAQNYLTLSNDDNGLKLSGSCNNAQPGTVTNAIISGLIASDTQGTPTQNYGVRLYNTSSSFAGLVLNGIMGSSNITALTDGSLIGATNNQWQTNRQVLYVTGAVAGNGADTTEDAMQSFTIPASTLGTTGTVIHVFAGGNFVGSTDTKTVKIRWGTLAGATFMAAVGSTASNTGWSAEAWITKTGPNTQAYAGTGDVLNGTNTGTRAGTTSATDTAPIQVFISGQNATNPTANSITCQFVFAEVMR